MRAEWHFRRIWIAMEKSSIKLSFFDHEQGRVKVKSSVRNETIPTSVPYIKSFHLQENTDNSPNCCMVRYYSLHTSVFHFSIRVCPRSLHHIFQQRTYRIPGAEREIAHHMTEPCSGRRIYKGSVHHFFLQPHQAGMAVGPGRMGYKPVHL